MAYNWAKLKTKFITGNYNSLKDFAEREKVPYKTVRENAGGWRLEKGTKERQKQDKIISKITDQQVERAACLNQRYIDTADLALEKVMQVLSKELTQSIDMYGEHHFNSIIGDKKLKNIVETMAILQKTHRIALGMDREDKGITSESNNKDKQVIIHIDTDMSDEDINKLLGGHDT